MSCGEEEFVETHGLIGFSVFDPPIAVIATLKNRGWSVRAVEFRGRDLSTTSDMTRTLTNDEGLILTQAIRESRVWITTEPNKPFPEQMTDGEMWIIEARRNGNYLALRRWRASEQPIRALGAFLARLTGLPQTLFQENLPRGGFSPIPPPEPHWTSRRCPWPVRRSGAG